MNEFRPLLIGALVVTEVAMWQWRMVIAHRGRRLSAMLLGFVGAALQITAISQVVADVHDVLSIAAYAGGVGCGVLFGLVAGERLTPGRLEVSIVSGVPRLAEALWVRGWSAIAHSAESPMGSVTTVEVEIDRRDAPRLRDDAREIDPSARWTAKEIRTERGVNMQQHPELMRATMNARSRDIAAAAERRRQAEEHHRYGPSTDERPGWKLVRAWRLGLFRRPAMHPPLPTEQEPSLMPL